MTASGSWETKARKLEDRVDGMVGKVDGEVVDLSRMESDVKQAGAGVATSTGGYSAGL